MDRPSVAAERGGAPYRGEHNGQVLAEWLGMAPAEVDGLAGTGVVQAEERPDPVAVTGPGPDPVAVTSPRPDPVQVAVVGPGEASDAELEAARIAGAVLARGGATVVCGGLGGVMEAVCRGASEAGGRTIGILPGSDWRVANPWVQAPVATGLGELRNGLVVRSADAVLALGGAYGTLSEIALALRLGRPVVGWRTWELSRGGGPPDAGVERLDEPAAAAEAALSAARLARAAGSAPD